MQRRTFVAGLMSSAGASLVHAADEDFPSRPLKLIVPFAPGGGADFLARAIADAISPRLGQAVVVDNRPGGGGTTGAVAVASARADGYTLLYGTPSAQMVNPYLMKSLPYDPNAFAPVAPLGRFTNVLAVNSHVPVKTVKELVDYARAKPGMLNFCSAGVGTSSHLAGELFKHLAEVDIRHVPYRGTGAALQDLLSGTVQMAFDSVSVYLPHFKAGTLRPLGITDDAVSPLLPGVPPISQTLPGFRSSPETYIATRTGTPRKTIDRLNAEINAALKVPELRERLSAAGITLSGGSPEVLATLIASEAEKWKQVIQVSGAQAE